MTNVATHIDALVPGARIGSYDIVARIAEGGMGAVYEVEHRVTKQRRALKIVKPELARNPEFRGRFVREATIVSAVKHPNLVDTQDPFEGRGCPRIADGALARRDTRRATAPRTDDAGGDARGDGSVLSRHARRARASGDPPTSR